MSWHSPLVLSDTVRNDVSVRLIERLAVNGWLDGVRDGD